MKEADIIKNIILPFLLESGFKQEEITLDYTVTTDFNGGKVNFRPDIVLFDKNQPLLLIEVKSAPYFNFNSAVSQASYYSELLDAPFYAISDGNELNVFSKSNESINKIRLAHRGDETLKDFLLKTLIVEKLMSSNDNNITSLKIEEMWLTEITDEILLNIKNVDFRKLGARIVGWLGEKLFEEFCIKQGIKIKKPTLDLGYDFLVGEEMVEVKTILEHKNVKKHNYRLKKLPRKSVTFVFIHIETKINEDATLGYDFNRAYIAGYYTLAGDSEVKSLTRVVERSELLPITQWAEQRIGGGKN